MAECGYSLHQGSTESCKSLDHSINERINLFRCFSRYQVPTNSVAPHPSEYKPRSTHYSSIRSDGVLMLETSVSESLYGGQFTLSTQLIKPNYLVILSPTQHHSFFRNLPLLPAIIPTFDFIWKLMRQMPLGINIFVGSQV